VAAAVLGRGAEPTIQGPPRVFALRVADAAPHLIVAVILHPGAPRRLRAAPGLQPSPLCRGTLTPKFNELETRHQNKAAVAAWLAQFGPEPAVRHG